MRYRYEAICWGEHLAEIQNPGEIFHENGQVREDISCKQP